MRNRRKISDLKKLTLGERYCMRRLRSLSSTTNGEVLAFEKLDGHTPLSPKRSRRAILLIGDQVTSSASTKLRQDYLVVSVHEADKQTFKDLSKGVLEVPDADAVFYVNSQCYLHEKLFQTMYSSLQAHPARNEPLTFYAWGAKTKDATDLTQRSLAQAAKSFLRESSLSRANRREHHTFVKGLKALRKSITHIRESVLFADGIMTGHAVTLTLRDGTAENSVTKVFAKLGVFGIVVNQISATDYQIIFTTPQSNEYVKRKHLCHFAFLRDRSSVRANEPSLEEAS